MGSVMVQLIGDSELTAGVNESVNDCLSLYVAPTKHYYTGLCLGPGVQGSRGPRVQGSRGPGVQCQPQPSKDEQYI